MADVGLAIHSTLPAERLRSSSCCVHLSRTVLGGE